MRSDAVTLEADRKPGEPPLVAVMRAGRRLGPAPSLPDVRKHAAKNLTRLSATLRCLEDFDYRVSISPALHELAAQVDRNA